MTRFVFCAAFFCCLSSVHGEEGIYRASVRHIEGGGIGYERGYTTVEGFFAVDPGQWRVMPFFDARGHLFNNGKWAANGGVGLRALWKERVWGVNGYYDYRNSGRFDSNQVGAGLECLGELWDFRINGYLPVGKKTSDTYAATFNGFSGHHLLLSQKYQAAMRGGDAEVGFHFGRCRSFDFYAGAGPYFFIGRKDPTWGGKARIAGIYKDILALELSNSYDRTFHNKFQGQISLNFSFGPGSCSCKAANRLYDRVVRQEIIVIDNTRKNTVAINPLTGLPYYFVFVDNTSHSNGTYESPYPTLARAQNNSSPNDIIYVFPGDGTTRGMDSGITLQANQKFWGSGIGHAIQTTDGRIVIPALSSSFPTITNTNIDTDGNAIDLATNNAISGFIITSAYNDAIFGADPQSLDVSYCTFTNTTTYAIESAFSGDASVSITNNQFLNNVNGVILTLNGTSAVSCVGNTVTGQTSISSIPFEIVSNSNTLAAHFENNLFENNTTGSLRFDFSDLVDADISVLNNTFTNNGTGSQASLGSNIVFVPSGTTDQCSIVIQGNTFSGNGSNALYLHTSGAFTTLSANITENSIVNLGGSAALFATPVDTLTLLATNNTIANGNDNGIGVISTGVTSTGTITINNNTITDIGNGSNGIAISQDFLTLNLTILNNAINNCEGTGILSYAPDGIDTFMLNISGNTINNCQNLSSNASPGLDIEQYTNLLGSISNNTLSNNTGVAVFIGSIELNPSACLSLTGNSSSTDYLLSNPVGGLFNLTPCDVDTVNQGTINTSGVIDLVQSCLNPIACPP